MFPTALVYWGTYISVFAISMTIIAVAVYRRDHDLA